MKKYFILSVFTLITSYCVAQEDEFNQLMNELKSLMSQVETSKLKYNPEIELKNSSVVKYTLKETNSKGTTEENIFEVNFADLDAYTIRENTRGDVIMVDMKIKNNQKLIKSFADGKVRPYVNELSLAAVNIDNARAIRALIEKSVPLAEKMLEKRLSHSGYEERISWLEEKIGNVEGDNESVEQRLRHDPELPGKMILKLLEKGKSSRDVEYTFNLADLNKNSLDYKISGTEFGLKIETVRKNKWISYSVDGEPKPYTNEILIKTNDVEEARDIRGVILKSIPEARKKLEGSFPVLNNSADALKLMKTEIRSVNDDQKAYEQSIKENCICEVSVTTVTSSKSSNETYRFNLMDVNENFIEYSPSSTRMKIDVDMKEKARLVKVTRDNEAAPYTGSFAIYCEDTENARRMHYAIKKSVELCRSSYQYAVPAGETQTKIDWLIGQVKSVRIQEKEYSQELKLTEPADPTKITLTRREIDSKGSTEYIYEFNFSDVDPKTIDFDISSNQVAVKMLTRYKDKVIKYYKDGDIQNYKYETEIITEDVEQARNIIKALKEIVEAQAQ